MVGQARTVRLVAGPAAVGCTCGCRLPTCVHGHERTYLTALPQLGLVPAMPRCPHHASHLPSCLPHHTCLVCTPRLQLDLVLTSFNASVALVTAITGLFAMNVMLQVRASAGQLPQHCAACLCPATINPMAGLVALFAVLQVVGCSASGM